MAAAPDPEEVLCSTYGKDRFQRVTRLLISGGTALLREIFDQICPPSNLPTILKNPATVKKLKAAKLTKPQWDCLYPSPGVYGMSADFDITLNFRLLRTICSLTPPSTGWDLLPASTDHSLAADLARVKYYRNSVYGHVNQHMEITDDFEFLSLWQEISGALVRIAGQISPAKKCEWQEAIDNLLNDPLTTEDERNVQELQDWYRNDLEVKISIEELKGATDEALNDIKTSLKDFSGELCEKTRQTNQVIVEKVRDLETAVQEEAQHTRDELGELRQLIKRIESASGSSQSTSGERERVVSPEETTAHFSDEEILTEMGNEDGLPTQVTDHDNLETEDDEDVLSSRNGALDELSRRIQQLKRQRGELQNQFMIWTSIRKYTKALLIEHATKLSSTWSIRRVGIATTFVTLGAIILPCIVAILAYLNPQFGARFGFTDDAGGVDIRVTVAAGGVGAAVGALVGGGGRWKDVWTTMFAVLGSALGAVFFGAVVTAAVAGGDDKVKTGMYVVLGSALGAAFGCSVGGVGNGSAVGAIVGAVPGFVGGCEFDIDLGGVCFVICPVVFAILFALFGAFFGAVAGVSVCVLLGVVVLMIFSASGASERTSTFVFFVGAVGGALVGAIGFAEIGLQIGVILGALLDIVVDAVAGAAVGAGVGAAGFTGVQKYIMNTLRMRRVRQAIDKDKKSFQELQASMTSLEEYIVEFAVFCRENIHSVLSSTLLEDEFWFLINILRRTVPQSEEFRAEPNEEVLRTTLPNLLQEEANIHYTRVDTFLERFQFSTSNLEASEMSQELLECRSEEEIQTMIMNFIQAKFTETVTS